MVLSKPFFILVWETILYSGQKSNSLFYLSSGLVIEFSVTVYEAACWMTETEKNKNKSPALIPKIARLK